ncbi:MAG: hypothetical protein BME93_03870 [Methanosarcinales archaeon Met12]|nr:MAG: hypothetical protein BME93_03870 [Methanosarcinales archaeon Met12]
MDVNSIERRICGAKHMAILADDLDDGIGKTTRDAGAGRHCVMVYRCGCGKLIDSSDKFCSFCGHQLEWHEIR